MDPTLAACSIQPLSFDRDLLDVKLKSPPAFELTLNMLQKANTRITSTSVKPLVDQKLVDLREPRN